MEIQNANKEHETETLYVMHWKLFMYTINGDIMRTEASRCRSRARTCNASTAYIYTHYNMPYNKHTS